MRALPVAVIVDWAQARLGDPEAKVEREVIGAAADVRTICRKTGRDFTPEVCSARAAVLREALENAVNGVKP